jgi:hypothetical protein
MLILFRKQHIRRRAASNYVVGSAFIRLKADEFSTARGLDEAFNWGHFVDSTVEVANEPFLGIRAMHSVVRRCNVLDRARACRIICE